MRVVWSFRFLCISRSRKSFHDINLFSPFFLEWGYWFKELYLMQSDTYCKDNQDASLSLSYINMIGPLAKNRHSFKFVQNRSKIFW